MSRVIADENNSGTEAVPAPKIEWEAFLWGVLLAVPLGVFIWIWCQSRFMRRRAIQRKEELSAKEARAAIDLTHVVEADTLQPPIVEPAEPSAPDKLSRISGIGPKISMVLQEAGILTFAQLAQSQPEQLQDILTAANIRLANPETWSEQAALAAASDWDGLKQLQEELRRDRRR